MPRVGVSLWWQPPKGENRTQVGQGWHCVMLFVPLQGTLLFGFQLSLGRPGGPNTFRGVTRIRARAMETGVVPPWLGDPAASLSWGRLAGVLGQLGPAGRWHSTCISHRPVACQRGDAGGPCAGVARCSHAPGSACLCSAAELTSVVWQEELPRGCPCPAPPEPPPEPGRVPPRIGESRMGSCPLPWHGDSLVSLLWLH